MEITIPTFYPPPDQLPAKTTMGSIQPGRAGEPSQKPQADNPAENPEKRKENASSTDSSRDTVLTSQEMRIVQELKKTDTEVRQHEMAHIAAGGRYVTSGASFQYKRGPDGVNYAVGGEVTIDTSEIPGDPRATADKMRQVRRAALAPAHPSAQDRKVASKASTLGVKALADLTITQARERAEARKSQALGSKKMADSAYSRTDNPTQEPGFRLNIAV